MIEQFNGIIYLIIFIIHFVGYAFYAFRCLAGTKAFVDQYGMGDGAAIMTRFFGSFIVGSVLMAIYIGFVRADWLANTLAFFNLIFLQNVFAFIFAIWSHKKGNLGTNEKTSIEGIIAPGVLTLLSAILCYGLADRIYS